MVHCTTANIYWSVLKRRRARVIDECRTVSNAFASSSNILEVYWYLDLRRSVLRANTFSAHPFLAMNPLCRLFNEKELWKRAANIFEYRRRKTDDIVIGRPFPTWSRPSVVLGKRIVLFSLSSRGSSTFFYYRFKQSCRYYLYNLYNLYNPYLLDFHFVWSNSGLISHALESSGDFLDGNRLEQSFI